MNVLWQADLEELVMNWSEEKSVGDIILKYVSGMKLWTRPLPARSSQCRQRLNDSFCDLSLFFKILSQSRELVKAYPPFVNFFEMSKETIVKCERQKPRFHAFLKVLSSLFSVYEDRCIIQRLIYCWSNVKEAWPQGVYFLFSNIFRMLIVKIVKICWITTLNLSWFVWTFFCEDHLFACFLSFCYPD